MDILVDELARGMPDLAATVRIVLRAFTAALLGGVIGYERGRTGKDAGLRTHLLVSLGSALFVMAATDPKSGKPLAWERTEGKSRIIYLQLGHGPEAFANPNYRKLVAQSIAYVSRRK